MAKLPAQKPTFKVVVELTLVGKDLQHINEAKNKLRGCLREALKGTHTAVFITEQTQTDALNDGLERIPDISELQE